MAGQRIVYFAALLCGVMVYVANGAWLTGIALAVILGLPILSLLLSLPGILTFRLEIQGPEKLTTGEKGELWLLGASPYPMMPFRGRLQLKHFGSGNSLPYQPETGIPALHCGGYRVTAEKCRVCDYLGLFAFPVRRKEDRQVIVRPKALPVKDLPDLSQFVPKVWKPKFGGGYGENHELRLYRPGDSLNQVHWKLSAKTGNLTIREPMEPLRGQLLLTMTLRGAPEELDRKFGRLQWLGAYLVRKELAFELRVLTGDGVRGFRITSERELSKALDALLCAPEAVSGSIREDRFAASWQYHIGGQPDEKE